MLYAILCYASEDVVSSWSKAQDDEVMAKLLNVQQKYADAGRLGPVARLLPTTAATTLRQVKGESVVIDGPFAETKEQLLGLYVVNCDNADAALDVARDLRRVNPTAIYEIRPIRLYLPGEALPETASEGQS
jgi:hypothetical protein